jgi:hypothetical protein
VQLKARSNDIEKNLRAPGSKPLARSCRGSTRSLCFLEMAALLSARPALTVAPLAALRHE